MKQHQISVVLTDEDTRDGRQSSTAPSHISAAKTVCEIPGDDVTNTPRGSAGEIAEEDGKASHVKFIFLMSAACLSAFLVGLDQTIITTAIPQIADQFHSPEDVGWYGSAYLLTACAFQPIYGQVYRNFAVRPVYFLVLAIFLVGSLICALAPTSDAFIVGRALAGLGCAGVLSGNLNIVAQSVPLEKRAIYVSMLGTLFGIALVCGPIIGGALTAGASWEWCFWINLPIGAVTTAAIFVFFRPPKSAASDETLFQRLRKLDLVGSVLVITSAIELLLALQWGGVTYAWNDSKIIGLLVGSGVEAVAFLLWQRWRGKEALVPLHILRDRTVAATIAASFFQSGATFLPIFYLPYWFQVVRGASSLISGVDMIPWMVGNFLAALLISIVVTKTGWLNVPLLIGPAIGSIGAGLLVTLSNATSDAKWIGFQILNSAGLGAARQQYFLSVQAVLPPKDIPVAISFVLFSQNLGGSVLLSVANALIRNSLSNSLTTTHFDGVSDMAILNAGPTEVRALVRPDQLERLTAIYNTALRSVWILGVPVTILAIACALPMRWLNLKKNNDSSQQRKLNANEKAGPA